jgi:hypothetical protein
LKVGDLVYSVDDGAIMAVPVVGVGSTPVSSHHVLRVRLDNGEVLEMSPGHPTAEGRPFSELSVGSVLGESRSVVDIRLVPYRYTRTYDILPDSSTGTYFAAGALVGSTLRAR